MARPRTFDIDTVLKAVLEEFWLKGYQGTSYEHLREVTGLNKPSLYAAFGDKEQLFCRALDHYHATLLGLARKALDGQASARQAIRDWLIGFLPTCTGKRGRRGCLSINTALEGVSNQAVQERLHDYARRMEGLVRQCLADGKRRGEFSADFDVPAATRAVLAGQAGLMVLGRLEADPDLTARAVDTFLTMLLPAQ